MDPGPAAEQIAAVQAKQAAWAEHQARHADEIERLRRHIFETYYALPAAYRSRSHWVMSSATRDRLVRLFVPTPPDPDADDGGLSPTTRRDQLLGVPVVLRDGADGIQLEVEWRCFPADSRGHWWHEPGCSHVR